MFEQNPKLRNIHPTKLRIINEIKEQSKYQSAEELLPQILQINQELKRRNLSFTKEESALLLEAMELEFRDDSFLMLDFLLLV